jgi:hypothetical protein
MHWGGLQYIQGAYTWTTLVTKYLLFIISMKRNKFGGGLQYIWGGAYIWNGVNVSYVIIDGELLSGGGGVIIRGLR